MPARGWLIWLSSALMAGGAVVLGQYAWTQHERVVAQRLAKMWLHRTMEVHRLVPRRRHAAATWSVSSIYPACECR
jgi:hypothetical protein